MSNVKSLAELNATIGTAATEDITTSATDTTAGRMLKVGDFGLGVATPSVITDLNTVGDKNGFFRIATSGVTNAPSASFSAAALWQTYYDNNITHQLVIERLTGNSYTRVKSSGTWGAWRQIYHTGNLLGTVSQSAGVPTGAVIETGSNVNGSYTKFADGTMICAHNKSVTPASVISNFYGSTAGNIYNSGVDWYFAATFITAPEVVCTGDNTFAQIATAPTTTKVRLQAQEQASGTPVTIRAFAIGRWF